jgi:hypothetical protein
MIKKLLVMIFVFSVILGNLCCYAFSVPVTKERLESAFKLYENSGLNTIGHRVTVNNDTITFTVDGKSYNVKYNLKNDPTFTFELTLKQGTSYSDYQDQIANIGCGLIPFFAIANIQGVGYEKSYSYAANAALRAAFEQAGSISSSEGYMIVADGVTVTGGNMKTIRASDFGNHVIEYTKAIYGKSAKLKDSLFEYSTELKDITSSSCKYVAKLVVKENGDYTSLGGAGKAITDETPTSTDKTVTITTPEPVVIVNVPKLSDIVGTRYETAVNVLLSLGIVNGYDDNTFRPNSNVTRAQFAKMLVEATKIEPTDDSAPLSFSDLADSHWAYNYIRTAVQNGLINGYPEGLFKPDNSVTYAESMAMILRAMKLEETMLDRSWPTGYINEAKRIGLLESVEYAGPNVEANRGETAISLYNMISLLNSGRNLSELSATYAKGGATVTLKQTKDTLEFTLTGLVDGLYAYVNRTLDYSNGFAIREGNYLGFAEKITVKVEGDKIIVQSNSADRESLLNQISGTYYLQ